MWEKVKLGDICEINIGKTPSRNRSDYWGGNNKWIAIADLKGEKFINKTKESITDNAIEESGIKPIPPKTLIYSFKLSIGKIAITEDTIYSNEAIASLPIKNDARITINYLYWAMQVLNLDGIGDKAVMGITLNKQKLKNIKIPLPPLPIQEKIAAILDKADELRRKDQELQDKYDELAQAIFIDMFGDPVRNEKGWDMKKIKDIASQSKYSIKAGPFGSALKKEYYVNEGFKIYGQEQVIADDLTIGDYYISEEKFNALKSCAVSAGDILISLVGTYGKISIVPDQFEPGIINPRLMKITLNESIYASHFFKFVMQTVEMKNYISTFSRGGTMDIVNSGIISNLNIIVPPLHLQEEFAKKIELINNLKAKANTERSEELFQSLLQRAFKGELVSKTQLTE